MQAKSQNKQHEKNHPNNYLQKINNDRKKEGKKNTTQNRRRTKISIIIEGTKTKQNLDALNKGQAKAWMNLKANPSPSRPVI